MRKDQESIPPETRISVLGFLLALAWATYLTLPIFGAEPWGSIAHGNWHLMHGTRLDSDIWSVASNGVVDSTVRSNRNWLFDILVATAYNLAGPNGMVGLKLILIFSSIVALYSLFRALSREPNLSTLITALVSGGVFLQAELTPALGAILSFVVVVVALERAERGGLLSAAAIFLSLVLSNNLSTLAFIPLIYVAWRAVATKKLWLLAPLLFSVICNPQTFHLFLELYVDLRSISRDIFAQITGTPSGVAIGYGHGALVLLILLGALFNQSRALFVVCGGAALLLLALFTPPFLSAALIMFGAITARSWSAGRSAVRLREGIGRLLRGFGSLPTFGVYWLVCCFLLVEVLKLYRNPTTELLLPSDAVDFLMENNQLLPSYAPEGLAPYLAFRFSNSFGEPKYKAFGSTIWNPLRGGSGRLFRLSIAPEQMWASPTGCEELSSVLCRRGDPLCDALKDSNRWTIRYSSEISAERFPALADKIQPWVVWGLTSCKPAELLG